MQKAQVLYIHINGVTSEVIKNLVLAGIRATLCDTRSMDHVAETPSFFLPPETKKAKKASVAEATQPWIQDLNPLLGACPILAKNAADLTEDDVKDFSVVIASQIPPSLAQKLAKWSQAFYLTDSFGMKACCIMDLGQDRQYRPEKGKELLDPVPLKPYVSIGSILSTPLSHATNRFHKKPPPSFSHYRVLLQYLEDNGSWPTGEGDSDKLTESCKKVLALEGESSSSANALSDYEPLSSDAIQALATQARSEIAPVCAVLGGMIGNEVIKVISGKGEPSNNTLLMDGDLCKAWAFLVQPKESK